MIEPWVAPILASLILSLGLGPYSAYAAEKPAPPERTRSRIAEIPLQRRTPTLTVEAVADDLNRPRSIPSAILTAYLEVLERTSNSCRIGGPVSASPFGTFPAGPVRAVTLTGDLFDVAPDGRIVPSRQFEQLGLWATQVNSPVLIRISDPSTGQVHEIHGEQSMWGQIWSGMLLQWGEMFTKDTLRTFLGLLGYAAGGAVGGLFLAALPAPWLLVVVAGLFGFWAGQNARLILELAKRNRHKDIGRHLAVESVRLAAVVAGARFLSPYLARIPGMSRFLGAVQTALADRIPVYARAPGQRPVSPCDRYGIEKLIAESARRAEGDGIDKFLAGLNDPPPSAGPTWTGGWGHTAPFPRSSSGPRVATMPEAPAPSVSTLPRIVPPSGRPSGLLPMGAMPFQTLPLGLPPPPTGLPQTHAQVVAQPKLGFAWTSESEDVDNPETQAEAVEKYRQKEERARQARAQQEALNRHRNTSTNAAIRNSAPAGESGPGGGPGVTPPAGKREAAAVDLTPEDLAFLFAQGLKPSGETGFVAISAERAPVLKGPEKDRQIYIASDPAEFQGAPGPAPAVIPCRIFEGPFGIKFAVVSAEAFPVLAPHVGDSPLLILGSGSQTTGVLPLRQPEATKIETYLISKLAMSKTKTMIPIGDLPLRRAASMLGDRLDLGHYPEMRFADADVTAMEFLGLVLVSHALDAGAAERLPAGFLVPVRKAIRRMEANGGADEDQSEHNLILGKDLEVRKIDPWPIMAREINGQPHPVLKDVAEIANQTDVAPEVIEFSFVKEPGEMPEAGEADAVLVGKLIWRGAWVRHLVDPADPVEGLPWREQVASDPAVAAEGLVVWMEAVALRAAETAAREGVDADQVAKMATFLMIVPATRVNGKWFPEILMDEIQGGLAAGVSPATVAEQIVRTISIEAVRSDQVTKTNERRNLKLDAEPRYKAPALEDSVTPAEEVDRALRNGATVAQTFTSDRKPLGPRKGLAILIEKAGSPHEAHQIYGRWLGMLGVHLTELPRAPDAERSEVIHTSKLLLTLPKLTVNGEAIDPYLSREIDLELERRNANKPASFRVPPEIVARELVEQIAEQAVATGQNTRLPQTLRLEFVRPAREYAGAKPPESLLDRIGREGLGRVWPAFAQPSALNPKLPAVWAFAKGGHVQLAVERPDGTYDIRAIRTLRLSRYAKPWRGAFGDLDPYGTYPQFTTAVLPYLEKIYAAREKATQEEKSHLRPKQRWIIAAVPSVGSSVEDHFREMAHLNPLELHDYLAFFTSLDPDAPWLISDLARFDAKFGLAAPLADLARQGRTPELARRISPGRTVGTGRKAPTGLLSLPDFLRLFFNPRPPGGALQTTFFVTQPTLRVWYRTVNGSPVRLAAKREAPAEIHFGKTIGEDSRGRVHVEGLVSGYLALIFAGHDAAARYDAMKELLTGKKVPGKKKARRGAAVAAQDERLKLLAELGSAQAGNGAKVVLPAVVTRWSDSQGLLVLSCGEPNVVVPTGGRAICSGAAEGEAHRIFVDRFRLQHPELWQRLILEFGDAQKTLRLFYEADKNTYTVVPF